MMVDSTVYSMRSSLQTTMQTVTESLKASPLLPSMSDCFTDAKTTSNREIIQVEALQQPPSMRKDQR